MFSDSGDFWDFGLKVELFGDWVIGLNEYPGSLLPIPFGLLGLVLASHLVLAFSSLHGWWAKLMLGSRSNRVSSRPVPAPEGDEPPRPSTTAEPLSTDSNAIAVTEPESEPDSEISALDDSSDEDDHPETKEVESPRTAAQTSLSSDTPVVPEPFLKAVPNPVEVAEAVVDDSPDMTPITELTTREQEVFMLMAHGDTNADIAEELFISEGTVKTHVKRVLSKLYMRDRTQVVVFAYEKGIVLPGAIAAFGAVSENRSYGG
jgi:DNA-binding CsgD family transcriptional regulator